MMIGATKRLPLEETMHMIKARRYVELERFLDEKGNRAFVFTMAKRLEQLEKGSVVLREDCGWLVSAGRMGLAHAQFEGMAACKPRAGKRSQDEPIGCATMREALTIRKTLCVACLRLLPASLLAERTELLGE